MDEFSHLALGEVLRLRGRRTPELLAMTEPDARATYRELLERAEAVAAGLCALGVRTGDHVGLLMVSGLRAMEVLVGCWLLGAVAVPLNSRYKPAELRYVVKHAQLKVLLLSDSVKAHVDHPGRLEAAFSDLADSENAEQLAIADAPALRSIVYLGSTDRRGFLSESRFRELAAGAVERVRLLPPVDVSAAAVMIYTSGTTAQPKGCIHTHATIARQAAMTAEVMDLQLGDRLWDPLPVCHVGGVIPMMGAMQRGASCHTIAHFDPARALRHMETERATHAYIAFPTLINDLVECPSFRATDLSSLRWILAIGAPAAVRRVQATLPHVFQAAGYGATELGGVVVYSRLEDSPESRATTCGTPFPGIELRVVDADGMPLPPGSRGEIEMRGPTRIDGYFRDDSPLNLTRDGWLKTGDLGFFTDVGELVFEGRMKDMLKVGGENVAAAEIEAVLTSHPAVAVAAVIGMPDARLDEVPAAFVELAAGHEISEAELIAYCEGMIAGYKVPRLIQFIDQWPMSTTKVQKFRLRDLLPRA